MRVLVTGGSGYTGQFLEAALLGAGHEVFTTYLSSPLPPQPEGVPAAQSFRVDLATGEGLDACLRAAARLDAVVHTAALSQPVVCERDPAAAVAANVPTALLARLAQVAPSALFILFSTDNVYSGARPWWKESDPTEPVNAYGRTKVQAEVLVRSWPRHAILRCSLIYGPPPPRRPVARPLFLQWLDGALRRVVLFFVAFNL